MIEGALWSVLLFKKENIVAKKAAGALGGAVSPPAGFGAEPQEIFEFRPYKTPKSFNLGLV